MSTLAYIRSQTVRAVLMWMHSLVIAMGDTPWYRSALFGAVVFTLLSVTLGLSDPHPLLTMLEWPSYLLASAFFIATLVRVAQHHPQTLYIYVLGTFIAALILEFLFRTLVLKLLLA